MGYNLDKQYKYIMNYNKINYWETRKDPNNAHARTLTPHHIKTIKPFITDNVSVLEYGPGIGRMLDLYNNQTEINYYDITNVYRDRLVDKCKSSNVKINSYTIDTSGDITTQFEDNEFDIVCAFEVLLHSPETEITELMTELARIGKKVVIVTWYDNGSTTNSFHCWTRDYKKILNHNNLNLVHWDEESLKDQVFFIYEKK